MEVHHHAHTARKKWTHYFWEFLMLFLAVFCGFLAENEREHYIERKRAKDYARSLIHDLQNDTVQLSNFINQIPSFISKCDTFRMLSREIKHASTGSLYYFGSVVNEASDFTSTVSTLDQIKNSGSLRYFDAVLQDKISQYARLVDRNKDYKTFGIPEHLRGISLWNKIFDSYVLVEFFRSAKGRPALDSFLHSNPPLINNDPLLMKEFSNAVLSKHNSESIMLALYYKPAFKRASELIQLLKKKYHLK